MDYRNWLGGQAREYLGLELNGEQLDQFGRYYQRLVEGNRRLNLTAITEEKDVYIKHFYDSLTLTVRLPVTQLESVIDVGTGAGFPGIPLKIAFPHLQVVLLDSLNKRISFLQQLTEELGLTGVECVHGRAEEVARRRQYRESFDLATARAVAWLNVLAEYCLPFVRVGGWFTAMKGPDISEEIEESNRAVEKLGGADVDPVSLSLPQGLGERHLLMIRKESPTPKTYPRKPGTPSRKPII